MNFQGQNPSIFLRSGPLVYKRGRGQPPAAPDGEELLVWPKQRHLPRPLKASRPPQLL